AMRGLNARSWKAWKLGLAPVQTTINARIAPMFSMTRLKTLLILLLALALPLQGYAAAAMVFCASSETAEAGASSTPHHHSEQQAQLSDHSATHAKHDAASHGKTSS